MILVLLTRGNSYAGVPLRLPATPADMGEAYAKLDRISSTDKTALRALPLDNTELYSLFAQANWDDPNHVAQLNSLAEKMEQMTASEKTIFYGLISGNPQTKPEEVLGLVEKVSAYQLMKFIKSPEELGEYMVAQGLLDIPENVKPYLNYGAIGREQHQILKGSFTESGYVVRKGALAPNHGHDLVVFTLHLASSSGSTILRLPSTEYELNDTLRQLGVDEFAQAQIQKIEIGLPYLEGSIPVECACVTVANDLALNIEKMNQYDGKLLKYLSVLAVEQPETMADALFYANELDNYERVPDDTEEYGKLVLKRLGANRDVMKLLEDYTDFSGIGDIYMEKDDVRRTEFGLIRKRSGPFPDEAPGMVMGGM